eukprot:752938-Hanusia_phi.AAC.5
MLFSGVLCSSDVKLSSNSSDARPTSSPDSVSKEKSGLRLAMLVFSEETPHSETSESLEVCLLGEPVS